MEMKKNKKKTKKWVLDGAGEGAAGAALSLRRAHGSIFACHLRFSSAVFAIIFTCGYSMILDSWRMKQSDLAHEWSAWGSERSLPPRPGFDGKVPF